ncbi:MAG: RNA polymerase sigma factor [Candidatus Methylacidiphilales bacterium]
MKLVPGTLQEGGASFNTTHWTLILRAGHRRRDAGSVLAEDSAASESAREAALSAFCEAYWPPLYSFLRHRRFSSADAQDLVQAFFVHLIEHNTLGSSDREKGRLRTFLLGSLENFLINEHDRARALKRGGGYQIVPFGEFLPETEASILATSHLDDVTSYDVTWASNVVTRAWRQLREECAAEGKAEWFDALKPFLSGGASALPNQEESAARMGVPIATLRTWIARLRQRYRAALRAEVAGTVSDPADVEDELKYLYRILTA